MVGISFGLRKELFGLVGTAKGVRQQLHIAANKTLTSVESFMAKAVTEEINVTQKVVKKVLVQKLSSGDTVSGWVELSKSKQIDLKDFKARQTKSGVTYKISKKNKDRGRITNAFIVNKYDGQVYVRKTRGKGSGRGPLARKRGPSPWGAFTINEKIRPTVQHAQQFLNKQTRERIRFLTLRKSGTI